MPSTTGNSIQIDFEYFSTFLEDTNLTDDEKVELISSIAHIVMNFVSLGFDVHPLQQAGISGDEIEERLTSDITSLISSPLSKIISQNRPNSTELKTANGKESVVEKSKC